MTEATMPPACAPPRWDGRRVLFDLVQDGQRVTCAISLNALQDLSGLRRFKPADLLTCFAATRGRIEEIALHKLRSRTSATAGVLHIWSEDVDPLPVEVPAAVRGGGGAARAD